MEDEDGGEAVDDFAAALDAGVCGAEDALGFGGGEALVPEVDGEAEVLAQLLGEGGGFFGLATGVAGHVQRVAEDDLFDFELADDVVEGVEVVAAALAADGFEPLRGDAEGVGDGEADGAGAGVEAEDAAGQGRVGHGAIIAGAMSGVMAGACVAGLRPPGGWVPLYG